MPIIHSVLLALLLSLPALADEFVNQLLAEGDPDTQVTWAEHYEHGEGVDRDVDIAVQLYCHAARAGHPTAQYQLGWLYANGRGVARDDALAGAWFRLAADQGDAYAERMLRFFALDDESITEPGCILSDGTPVEFPEPDEPDFEGMEPPRDYDEVVELVRRLAPSYGLEPALVLAVIRVESNFDARALSPKDARGLMQLIPATAERFGVRDVWDPLDNLRGGMAYLRWLLDFFEGDVTLALAGYNAGERAVERHGGVPPYAETQAYVRRISRLLGPNPAVLLSAAGG